MTGFYMKCDTGLKCINGLSKCQNTFNNFPKVRSGLRIEFNTQQCRSSMVEKMETAIDNKENFVVFLTDLSQLFVCLSHDLLVAKLNSFGFSIVCLR